MPRSAKQSLQTIPFRVDNLHQNDALHFTITRSFDNRFPQYFTMPKVSLVRRHRRQSNLSSVAMTSADVAPCTTASLNLSTPRKVSDEDIASPSPDTSHYSDTRRQRRRASLKRPSPSVCLVDLDNTPQTPDPPTEEGESHHTSEEEERPSPTSPWGHFVDMLVPSDESMHSKSSQESTDSYQTSSFLPSCCCVSHEPYHRAASKRRRIKAPSPKKLKGFVLHFPESLDATQTALQSLRM